MRDAMLQRVDGKCAVKRAAYLHWAHPGRLWLTGLMPQCQRFRDDPQPRVDVALLPNEDEDALLLHRVQDKADHGQKLFVPVHETDCSPVPDDLLASDHVSPWPAVSLMDELVELAQSKHDDLKASAERYAFVSLPESRSGWRWHEKLGFN